jgi:glycosyltransferase involved in cell wall biosynthesis
MPKVSVNILTKNRAGLLKKALASVERQTFRDFEVVVIDDGSADGTNVVLEGYKDTRIQGYNHRQSEGISKSRQEALLASQGEYVAILDDDDEWVDADKLAKQVKFLDEHTDAVLCGGGILISNFKFQIPKFRPSSDAAIRSTMLLRNNFFTSAVMFRREAAIKAGGFIADGQDLAEDYDLWLRMGKLGKMYNFPEVFTAYRQTQYNKERFGRFLAKQLKLIGRHKSDYPYYHFAALILRLRLKFLIPNS